MRDGVAATWSGVRQALPTNVIDDFAAVNPTAQPGAESGAEHGQARPRHDQLMMLLRFNLVSTLLVAPLLLVSSVLPTTKHIDRVIRSMAMVNVILTVFYGVAMYVLEDKRTKMLAADERLVDLKQRPGGLENQMHRLEAERDALIVERKGLKIEHNDSKLATLQATLKSHFIFNTLNAIVTLIQDDPQKAEQATLGLARVLRAILEMRDRPLIPLRSEIGIIKEYVQIEKIRLGARMTFSVDAQEEVLDILVPSMILQPLVENAIQHGICQRRDGGAIQLRAFAEGEKLRLEVVDNGPGISMHAGNGQAMSLIRERLANLYEDQSELTLERDPAKRETIVSLIIPDATPRCA